MYIYIHVTSLRMKYSSLKRSVYMDMFYISSCSTSLNFVSFLKVNSMIRNIIGKIATVLIFLFDFLKKI